MRPVLLHPESHSVCHARVRPARRRLRSSDGRRRLLPGPLQLRQQESDADRNNHSTGRIFFLPAGWPILCGWRLRAVTESLRLLLLYARRYRLRRSGVLPSAGTVL